MSHSTSRRSFLQSVGIGTAALGLGDAAQAQDKTLQKIQGFEEARVDPSALQKWKPVSDRKIRVGIVGYGYCRFGAQFSFQDHPNVEVVAVSDLIPDRCAGLAKACRCEKTYPSLEELVKDDQIEAVFVATDPPNHARHCIDVLNHGKHVACAVPAVYGSLEDADKLFETVKKTGLKYMMYETSSYMPDVYAMHRIYEAGGFGKLIYSEGEYNHYSPTPLPSYQGWRIGPPPLWYATHSTAEGRSHHKQPQGHYEGQEKKLPDTRRPGLPPGVRPGGHRGSHGQLTNEFIMAILEDRQPWIDIVHSLNLTIPGVVAHLSAMKGGELMKIPQYKLA